DPRPRRVFVQCAGGDPADCICRLATVASEGAAHDPQVPERTPWDAPSRIEIPAGLQRRDGCLRLDFLEPFPLGPTRRDPPSADPLQASQGGAGLEHILPAGSLSRETFPRLTAPRYARALSGRVADLWLR